MERIVKQPDLLLCADFHLRDTIPVARLDNYLQTQCRKLSFINELQKKYRIPILHAGDLCDTWKTSPFLLSFIMENLPKQFFTVIGNHEAPSHNLDLIGKSGLNVLATAGIITILNRCHFGQEPTEPSFVIKNRNILVWHKMVWQGKKPYPTCTDEPASNILKKYPQFDLIVTGDNHKTFVEYYEGRVLVNPGSMMRMDADQADHKPSVFLWYASDNSVQQVFLPIEEGVVSRSHLIKNEERNERLDSFISKLNSDYSVSLSFEDNLQSFFKINNTSKDIQDIIYASIEINTKV
jgi:predicted phosphodiesterase